MGFIRRVISDCTVLNNQWQVKKVLNLFYIATLVLIQLTMVCKTSALFGSLCNS